MPQELNKASEAPRPEVLRPPEAAPEAAPERPAERPQEAPRERPAEEAAPPSIIAAPAAAAVAGAKDPEQLAIENILAEGLEDLYRAMPRELQARFKERGEETASRINEMIDRAKIKARKILGLIKGWLRLIPGVSRFFLEQEAKIKTDKILEYAEKEKQQSENVR